MSIKSVLSGIWAFILWLGSLAILFLWGKGLIHSFKKHDDLDGYISLVPPWGIYRGIESFWHKDPDKYDGIDWDKRVRNDIQTVCEIISFSADKDKKQYPADFNEQVEKFSSRISDYPTDKKQIIKDAAKEYIRYNLSMAQDLIDYAKQTNKNAEILSATSNRIYDSLYFYYKFDEIAISKKLSDSALVAVKKSTNDVDPVELVNNITTANNLYKGIYLNTYYQIFNERLIL